MRHPFTFRVLNKNLANSTLLIQYIPDNSNLSDIVQWVGVPPDILLMDVEQAKEAFRKVIIVSAPYDSWDTELYVLSSELLPELDTMIDVEWPEVTEEEIDTVLAELEPEEEDEEEDQ